MPKAQEDHIVKQTLYKVLCLSLAGALLLTGSAMAETLAARNIEPAAITLPAVAEESPYTLTGSSSWKHKVVALDWYDGGSSVLKKGHYGYIYDIGTGITVKIKRMGGTSHADVEPATKKDTAKLKKLSGGSWSWNRRPVILYASGKFVACSINTMPHGDQTITNNGYDGQFCLHMVNSRTHGSDQVDPDHMAAIKKAYNWAH